MNGLLVSLDQYHILLDNWMLRQCRNGQFDFTVGVQLGFVIVNLNESSRKNYKTIVVYYVVRPAEIIVRKEGKKIMRERDLTFKPLRPDR